MLNKEGLEEYVKSSSRLIKMGVIGGSNEIISKEKIMNVYFILYRILTEKNNTAMSVLNNDFPLKSRWFRLFKAIIDVKLARKNEKNGLYELTDTGNQFVQLINKTIRGD